MEDDVNTIMSRVPRVGELSPHLWLAVYQAGHEKTMRDIVSFADLLGHETLRARCPLYLILRRNLATLGEIDAWWKEISGHQKQMGDRFDSFAVVHAPYGDEPQRWKFWKSPEPNLSENDDDVQVLIDFLLGVLNDLQQAAQKHAVASFD